MPYAHARKWGRRGRTANKSGSWKGRLSCNIRTKLEDEVWLNPQGFTYIEADNPSVTIIDEWIVNSNRRQVDFPASVRVWRPNKTDFGIPQNRVFSVLGADLGL
jgi:hypothetical protein